MGSKKIVVVEDEEDILELVSHTLRRDGHTVSGVSDGEDAPAFIRSEAPDLVLLDLMLPGLDGLEICKILKADNSTLSIPIIMLTAKGEEADIVTGLELGADDYITKPFSPRILSARVKACLRKPRRAEIASTDQLKIHSIAIHTGRHEARVDGELIELTLTEFRILKFLAKKPGWVFTRYQIVDSVHGDNHPVTDRSVDVQIVSLRKKLGDAGKVIETVRGIGYRMSEDSN